MGALGDDGKLAVLANELGIAGLGLAVVVVLVTARVAADAVVLAWIVRARIGKAKIFVNFCSKFPD